MNEHQQQRGGEYRGSSGPPPRRDQAEAPDPAEILRETAKERYYEGGKLRAALLDAEAQAVAKSMSGVPTTQLRRFFDQVGAIRRRLDVDDSEVLAQAAFLKASAAYASGRDSKYAPILRFMVRNVNAIENKNDFVAFHRHFEAVMAFHKVFGPRKD